MSKIERRVIWTAWLMAGSIVAGSVLQAAEEPAAAKEKKSGFFGRVLDMVKKKEDAPPPAPPPEVKTTPKAPDAKPKAKSTASTAKKSTPKSAVARSKAAPKKEPAKETNTAATAPKPQTTSPADPKKDTAASDKPDLGHHIKVDQPAGAKPMAAADAKPEEKPVAAPGTPATAEPAKTPPSPTPAVAAATTKSADVSPKDEENRPIDVTKSGMTSTVTSVSKQLTESSAASTSLPPAKGIGWQVVKLGGRDYITAQSIQNFYAFASLKVDGNQVWLKSNNLILKATIGSQELLINNIKFILSYPVAESGGKALFSRLDLCKLLDPVLRPSYITGDEPFDTVVIDAGHGGHDAGAKGVYGYEKDFALQMARAVKAALVKRGFKVVMTRDSDVFISRTGRVAIANKTPNSIFLSFHFNSAGSAATGIETFALTPQGSSASLERGGGYNASGRTGNKQDSENIALATAVHALVIHKFKLIDRGIKRAQWTVLTGCDRPGILFEGGFVTNATECRLIASTTYRTALAETVGDAVLNYRRALSSTGMVKKDNPYSK